MWTEGDDAEAISQGIYNTYVKKNLRYSQVIVRRKDLLFFAFVLAYSVSSFSKSSLQKPSYELVRLH